MNLGELIAFLKEIGAEPKRSLSQNFLIDQNIVQKIVKTAEIAPEDVVLEIGPGPGALTELLLQKGATLFAVEKDDRFAKHLSRFQTEDGRLTVFHQDALKFPIETLPSSLKVVANLPYHITTPLLERLFSRYKQMDTLTLMMQKEVGERILAKPATKAFGSLTLFTQMYAEAKTSFTVSAGCFYPKPKVESIVIHFAMREKLPVEEPETIFKWIRLAFQKRRKMIRSSLKEHFSPSKIDEALKKTNLSLEARPETLSLEEWIQFIQTLSL